MRNIFILGVVWAVSQLPIVAQSGQAISPQEAGRAAEVNLRANEVSKWRHVAKSAVSPGTDSVNQQIRQARDQFFDRTIGAPEALDKPSVGKAGFVTDRGPDLGPEIGPSDVVAVITFDDYQPYLSASKRSVYTEIRFSVQRFLKPNIKITAPTTLTLIDPGGIVKTPSAVVSYGSNLDTPYDLQPNHRYVVFLRHISQGDFYYLDTSWELLGGVVYPNSQANVERAKAGTSLYSGMREDDFLRTLSSVIATWPESVR